MKEHAQVHTIAFVGDHLPRQCGIATFTSDLLAAVATASPHSQCFSVSVNDIHGGYEYPEVVRCEIEEQDVPSYLRAADFLNLSNVDIVCLQHEFGIFGGPAGGHILALLREVRMPVVTTLHTVLREPKADQRRVMQALVSLSTRLVVMAERGRRMLQEIYQAPPAKIDLIPHGIPDVGFVDPTYFKDQFGVAGRVVLLTFGLLSPNKGIEYVLNALPHILAEFPEVVYIVLGATHPNELREHGEAYRLSLEMLATKNQLEKHVIFYNRFVDRENLQEFIGAADLYITPYLNEAQSTSGTLAYTFGAGKAVVSTPYWYAAELLADDRGVLVPFGDAQAIAREVIGLLRDDTRRHAMRKNAYRLGRAMVWSNVAQLYRRSFECARLAGAARSRKSLATKTLDHKPRELPALKLRHLARMTDSTGVFQHAIFSVPNFSEGYCTDDNARAFILAVLLGELGEDPECVRTLATTCAAFLHHAFDRTTQRFHNHLSFDRRWLDAQGSEDCQGRALWALGLGVGRSPLRSFQMLAGQLFALALPALTGFTSPRAWAFGLLGMHAYLRRLSGDSLVNHTRETLTSRLMERFEATAQPDWQWCEEALSYDNATLAHALILSGRATGQHAVLERGLQALRWLTEVHMSEQGHFRPIGSNGFYRRGGTRAHFDQQPIEAQATVSACLEAYRATADVWWYAQAQRAFDWFLGWNDLGLALYSPETGGCHDGLHVDRVNRNQGAESTLAFLLALAEMRLAQNMLTSFKEAIAVEASSPMAVSFLWSNQPMSIHHVKRTATILKPDQSRILLRPFTPGDPQRVGRIIARIMALPEDRVGPLLDEVSAAFSQRHQHMRRLFLERFEQVRDLLLTDEALSEPRRLLIGSYFLAEYSLESAALFNPSIVPHPDQTDLPSGALRFILSLRATGEGHISSITFRTGIIHPDHRIEVFTPTGLLTEPRQIPNPHYEKALFARKLFELGLTGAFTRRVMHNLGDWFELEELGATIAAELKQSRQSEGWLEHQHTADGVWMLAKSNCEVQFQPDQRLSERIIFPATPSQRNGIEDARFVCFQNEDGTHVYYATFTAFDGKVIVPELVETADFLRFRFITLNGPAAENKGMALFPRKINGLYAMLSRQDNENISLMFSDNVHFWYERKVLLTPTFPWELVQVGNCGSPIETDAGWLVLSHGVGPMRTYCIGAFLLDRDDPAKVIGRLREPLLTPNQSEREGYVPNVVYTCGALLHNGALIMPYGLADHATSFATVPLDAVLAAMHEEAP